MKTLIKTFPILTGTLLVSSACGENAKKGRLPQGAHKPNVVYILMDDMGYGDLGSYGQKLIETPNIDALASSGIRFTQSYAGAPVSGPSRCVLLTGKHTGHSIVRGNDEMDERGEVWNHDAMLADSTLEGQYPMPKGTRTLGHLMQDAGYQTAMIGKWGLGYPGSESTPNKMGFDFFYGYNCQRQAHTFYPMFLYRNEVREYLDNAPVLHPHAKLEKGADKYDEASYAQFSRKEYSSDLMFDEVVDFVDDNKDKPFFLMWTTPIPHVPLQAPKEWVDYYLEKFGADEEPYLGELDYLPVRYPRASYAAMISHFDEQVGKLVAKLKADGIYDNTLIVFTSDNGPTFNGGAQSPWFNSGGPFKSERGWGKTSLHEGGIRVPMIVSWPNVISERRVSDHVCAFWDVLPTMAEIVGAEAIADTDGISFLPEILGETQAEHESLFWAHPEGSGSRAVRMGKWKGLIENARQEGSEIQLFDLENDIQELNNVADKYPEIVAQIREIMKNEYTEPANPRWKF